MPRDEYSPGPVVGQPDPVQRFMDTISDLDPAQLPAVLQRVFAAGLPQADPFARTSPARRRPRRAGDVTYRVRVDLTGTKPPLWRRLELASDLYLDDVHEVIQVAFGWTDSHLHRFGVGPGFYRPDTEYYLCPFDVGEGEVGVPEDDVRLDEVLVDVGDTLLYAYDFGDDWQHVIRLEAVLPQQESTPRAVCVTGRREGAAEDCGGVPGYELIEAATDPTRVDSAEAAAEFARVFGSEIDPGAIGTTPFDLDQINADLADIAGDLADLAGTGELPDDMPGPLVDLVASVRSTAARRELRRLLGDARIDQPVLVDAETASQMVQPYTWLLNQVGTEGIALTAAGYLPPVHVRATWVELGLDDEWIGKGNREIQTLPVLDFRRSAQRMGLLRKYRGRLLATSRGHRLRTDPVALWWHLAERMPLQTSDACERQAGLLLLVAVAAQLSSDLDAAVARLLDAIGWVGGDGSMLPGGMASHASWDSKGVLRRLGAMSHQQGIRREDIPTAAGVTFARAALQTWPERSGSGG